MEILIRLLVWALNRTFGRQNPPALHGTSALDQTVLLELEESRRLERDAQRQTQIVQGFKSSATAVQGAVDYDDLKWESYDRAVETPGQFVFYNGRSIQKVIAKAAFRNHQELVTLRRVVHRHVPNCELRDD